MEFVPCDHRDFAPDTKQKGEVVYICQAAVRLGWHTVFCRALTESQDTCAISRHLNNPEDQDAREEVEDLLSS